MMIFDTHAHYDDEAFDEDREELLQGLHRDGVGRIVNVGASLSSCKKTMEIAGEYPFVYAAIGVHPGETGELDEESFSWIKQACRYEKCVAVGEIGLDYHWPEPEASVQKYWFERQMDLARELKKPMIIHSRDAAKDTVDLMMAKKAGEIGGVIHCYSYSRESAGDYLNMGFFFGIGGVLTFKNARKLKEAAAYIPLESIVLETDAPYLAPEPYRGKRNRSRYISYVADVLAQMKGISGEEVIRITWENGCRLYGLPVELDKTEV